MLIKVLVENISIKNDLKGEHGLSLYIETNNHKILFDVGASGLFLENAQKLNVNIAEVDYLIISHGHYDHGGGLESFIQVNRKAEIFLHRKAFEDYYALSEKGSIEYIGLDEAIKNNKKIIFTSDRFFIHKGIQLFSNIKHKEPRPSSNHNLLMKNDGQVVKDTFSHEQNLIIEEGKTVLFTGCAHNGIINILEHFRKIRGHMPDYVIGGFHLNGLEARDGEKDEMLEKIGKYLMDTQAKFYTCHCTGIEPYNQLKGVLGNRIEYLSTGCELVIS